MKTFKITKKERLNKFLATTGLASRRGADDLISNGLVKINHKTALLGAVVTEGDTVTINSNLKELEYILYHKPRGEVTGVVPKWPHLHPVGRLDKQSEGLILLTNDTRVVEKLLNPKFGREREYDVTVKEKATPRVVTILKRGIYTREDSYAPVIHSSISNEGHNIRIVLEEGKKHEIRRMLNALNLTITKLKRTRIMHMKITGITTGEGYKLKEDQVKRLLNELEITTTQN